MKGLKKHYIFLIWHTGIKGSLFFTAFLSNVFNETLWIHTYNVINPPTYKPCQNKIVRRK